MGGQAFAHLSTPRMPPSVYNYVLNKVQTLLKQHYEIVDSPIEGPGKKDFGDIDVLVFNPLRSSPLSQPQSRPELAAKLTKYLGAVDQIIGPTFNFAIPWPEFLSQNDEKYQVQEPKYIQLDIHVCSLEHEFRWELFHAAHGDLWNILGSTIRRFGLTVNGHGLFLRIPEIEKLDRKKSLVFLTEDHGLILEFLGLEKERWWRPFASKEEMFEYAAGCRMFWVKGLDENEGDDEGFSVEGGEDGKKELKHNDRARMGKRPAFREWMEDFLPRCREEGKFMQGKGVTREQVRDEVFERFGGSVKTEYETKLKDWTLVRHADNVWRSVIKGTIPEIEDLQFRAASIRTLKGIIMEGEPFKGNVIPEVARNEEGFWDIEKVQTFVRENWKEAGDIGWARQQEKALEGMKAKTEKKKLRAEEEANKRAKIADQAPT